MKKEETGNYREEKIFMDFSLAQRPNSTNPIISDIGHMTCFSKNTSPGRGYSLNKIVLLLEKLDSRSLVSIIDGERDIGVISFVLDNILWRDKKFAEEVVKQINIDELVRKILLEDNLDKINFLVSRFSWLSREINLRLAENFDLMSLARKIDKEQNLDTICQTLFEFYVFNEKMTKKLLNKINFETLLWKVIVENDFEKVAILIYYLYLVYGKFSKNLATIVGIKFEKEENLEKVMEFIFKLRLSKSRFEGKLYLLDIKRREQEPKNFEGLKNTKNSLGQKIDTNILRCIVEKIDLENLARKIDLEKRFERIFEFFSELAKLNKEISIELLSKINIEYLVLKYEEADR